MDKNIGCFVEFSNDSYINHIKHDTDCISLHKDLPIIFPGGITIMPQLTIIDSPPVLCIWKCLVESNIRSCNPDFYKSSLDYSNLIVVFFSSCEDLIEVITYKNVAGKSLFSLLRFQVLFWSLNRLSSWLWGFHLLVWAF